MKKQIFLIGAIILLPLFSFSQNSEKTIKSLRDWYEKTESISVSTEFERVEAKLGNYVASTGTFNSFGFFERKPNEEYKASFYFNIWLSVYDKEFVHFKDKPPLIPAEYTQIQKVKIPDLFDSYNETDSSKANFNSWKRHLGCHILLDETFIDQVLKQSLETKVLDGENPTLEFTLKNWNSVERVNLKLKVEEKTGAPLNLEIVYPFPRGLVFTETWKFNY